MTRLLAIFGVTPGFLALLVGGIIGSWLRARFSDTQRTWSWKTMEDVILGGAFATLLPYFVASIPWLAINWATIAPAAQFMMALALGVTGSWIYTRTIWKRRVRVAADLAGIAVPPAGSPEVMMLSAHAVATEAVAAKKQEDINAAEKRASL